MNSLVGYGVSSSSEDEEEDHNSRATESPRGDAARKNRNFLLESESASSESESEDQESLISSSVPPRHHHSPNPGSSASCTPKLLPPPLDSVTPKKLPPPALNASSDSGVFANPFKAQADQKLSALQKHVPLTMQARPSQIGGKKVCVAYRKDGRCRFGIKCKFAHDSDLQTAGLPGDRRPSAGEETPEPAGGSQSCRRESNEKDAEQQMKKRRVGLSNSLIPPKRAMKQYSMQRDRERINMS